MAATPPSFELYRELADAYERLGQATMRDRFLMLAADAALQAGQTAEAERLRQRLLSGSRHHMLKPYSSFAEASNAPDVQTYLRDLRLNYPPDVAGQMLASLQAAPSPTAASAPAASAPPAAAPARTSVPATAPLMDVAAPNPQRPKPAKPVVPETTYPLAPEVPVKAPPRAAPKPAPKAAPAPATAPKPAATATAPAAPPSRQPAATPAPAPLKVEKIVAPTRGPRNSGAWFSGFLAFVVFVAGLAVAVVTLGRPYLPDDLLR
ncbi:MAG: hypothetical protein SNJ82_06855 [Gemmataceae bacterium]